MTMSCIESKKPFCLSVWKIRDKTKNKEQGTKELCVMRMGYALYVCIALYLWPERLNRLTPNHVYIRFCFAVSSAGVFCSPSALLDGVYKS
jgi:hypothetical protein